MVDLNRTWNYVETVNAEEGHVIELAGDLVDCDLVVACEQSVSVYAVNADGEAIFFARGDYLHVNERLEGCYGLEIRAGAPFHYACLVTRVTDREDIDPTPVAVSMKVDPLSNLKLMVRDEMARYIKAGFAEGLFADGMTEEELLEDFLTGDHEFDEDEDDFGDGYTEMDEEVTETVIPEPVEEEKQPEVPPPITPT